MVFFLRRVHHGCSSCRLRPHTRRVPFRSSLKPKRAIAFLNQILNQTRKIQWGSMERVQGNEARWLRDVFEKRRRDDVSTTVWWRFPQPSCVGRLV